MFNQTPFALSDKKTTIDPDAEVVFVSDLFLKDYVGGAELTSQALIDASPFKIDCVKSKDVSIDLLKSGHEKYWIFGNFSAMDPELIPTIVANLKYSVLEYDYKYCKYRSPEKHKFSELSDCDCHTQMVGKMISAFYYGAKSLWWMSEGQEDHYHKLFPFLAEKESVVLSSVFDEKFFAMIKILKKETENIERNGWIVLGSSSWIKGAQEAEQWCKDNNKEYEVLWGIPYESVLEKLAFAEGFVYLPQGMDTCPRMVIEAKLLGCKLHLNEYVQHKDELWFNTEDQFDTEAYLYAARERFWNSIKAAMEWTPTISGYTTTKDCISQDYPFKQCIESMLNFSDEVVVVDGGSSDGTLEVLQEWAEKEEKLKVFLVKRDWDHPRHGVFDGMQKAEARSRCTSEFLWQMDSDEIVHENDVIKIQELCRNFPAQADLVSLPVIEYWGGPDKVRMDVNPWKWRLSKNKPHITHGIPDDLRRKDADDNLYAAPGTDGCDYIHKETFERIPHASFYSAEVENARRLAMNGNNEAYKAYSDWFQNVVDQLPGVHHYSWFDLERKIKTYRGYWQTHWESLYDIKQEDTAENNMFFQKPWKEVTDNDIAKLSVDLKEKMGGWVFHSPVDFSKSTPSLKLNQTQPKFMMDNVNED